MKKANKNRDENVVLQKAHSNGLFINWLIKFSKKFLIQEKNEHPHTKNHKPTQSPPEEAFCILCIPFHLWETYSKEKEKGPGENEYFYNPVDDASVAILCKENEVEKRSNQLKKECWEETEKKEFLGRHEAQKICYYYAMSKKKMTKAIQEELLNDLLNSMSERDLRALNRRVVEKIKLHQNVKNLQSMSKFSVFDEVSFMHNGKKQQGTILRLNQKSITLVTDDDVEWRIHPSLLTKIPGSKNIFE